MRKLFLKSILLLCTLIVGTVNVWGDTDGYTATSGDKPTATKGTTSSSVTGTNSISWSYSVTQATKSNKSPYVGYSDDYGWQLGSGNSPCTAFSISTSGISGNITQIEVVTGSASASSSINVTVGGSNFGTQGQTTGSGASVSTQTFTGSASGAIIISATASSGAFYFKSVTVTYSAETKSPHELSWGVSSKNVTFGSTPYDFPTLSNSHNLPITYSSSNTAVATINSTTGAISLKNVTGSTTIYATTSGDETYASGSVSYTLNVTFGPEDGEFDFSKSDYGSGVEPTSNGSSYVTSKKTWTAGNVTMETEGKYRVWSAASDLRMYNNTPTSSATFSVPAGYVITHISTTGGKFVTASVGEMTPSGDWIGVSQSVKLSISTSTVNFNTISVTYIPATLARTTEGYSTFYTPCKVQFTSSGTLKVYKGVLDGSTLKLYQYSSNIIPANTAVVLKSDEAISVAASSSDAGTAEGGESSLTGTLTPKDASTITEGTLCVLGQSEGVSGFYAFTGATLAANKAYLVVPAATPAPAIIRFEEEENNATDIHSLEGNAEVVKFIQNGQLLILRDGITYDALGRVVK